ncbi:MAG: 50S ribosomal protein L1 [Deltaproteobacteria bacterium]|nr:MAG: 50S ribosomal protein L1 [Deltaproteobacteria bacterium]
MPGKKYKGVVGKVDRLKRYPLEEALDLLPQVKFSKWDETVDVAVRLGVDPKQGDQMVRGATALPNGLGKKVRVVVFAKGEKQKEAQAAGADEVGAEDLIAKIEGGWMEFDNTIATPDMMGVVSRLGKVLGPRGLMPNPKLGTVTFDVAKAVEAVKAGQVEYKVDKAGNVHAPVGKVSFGKEKLKQNILALMESIIRAKPATSKGIYLRSVTLSSTMSPGIKLDPVHLGAEAS